MAFDPVAFLVLPVAVLSLMAHEVAHGLAALAMGDGSGRESGHLTLDPRPHLDPIGSLIVPSALIAFHAPLVFGWARPMPIERARLRRPHADSLWVALAGPAANLLLALGFAALARVVPQAGIGVPLRAAALAGVFWNCGLVLFNLIPIPPLDGSWVLARFLRLRHIVALHHFRLAALGTTLALACLPPSRGWFEAPLAGAVHVCLALFGIQEGVAG